MSLHRQTRRRLSLWMVGLMLLAQWLTAAYACPAVMQSLAPQASAMANCHGMTPGTMDPAHPALCKAHCESDRQAPAQAALHAVPVPALAPFIVAALAPVDPAAPPPEQVATPRAGAPPGWPPLYLTQKVLRN
jgi:hypothetical protein